MNPPEPKAPSERRYPIDAALLRSALAEPTTVPPLGSVIDVSRAKPAAVVVAIALDPEPSALLVLRGSYLKDHAGEVGFPGGKPEANDADLAATALRELEEEVGVAPSDVEICGSLAVVPVITGRYLIHPFVGVLTPGAIPRVASREIERVLWLPLAPLLSGERVIDAARGEWGGVTVFSPHFALDGCVLYGASAHIFYELLFRVAAKLGITLPAAAMQPDLPWGDRYSR